MVSPQKDLQVRARTVVDRHCLGNRAVFGADLLEFGRVGLALLGADFISVTQDQDSVEAIESAFELAEPLLESRGTQGPGIRHES